MGGKGKNSAKAPSGTHYLVGLRWWSGMTISCSPSSRSCRHRCRHRCSRRLRTIAHAACPNWSYDDDSYPCSSIIMLSDLPAGKTHYLGCPHCPVYSTSICADCKTVHHKHMSFEANMRPTRADIANCPTRRMDVMRSLQHLRMADCLLQPHQMFVQQRVLLQMQCQALNFHLD